MQEEYILDQLIILFRYNVVEQLEDDNSFVCLDTFIPFYLFDYTQSLSHDLLLFGHDPA